MALKIHKEIYAEKSGLLTHMDFARDRAFSHENYTRVHNDGMKEFFRGNPCSKTRIELSAEEKIKLSEDELFNLHCNNIHVSGYETGEFINKIAEKAKTDIARVFENREFPMRVKLEFVPK